MRSHLRIAAAACVVSAPATTGCPAAVPAGQAAGGDPRAGAAWIAADPQPSAPPGVLIDEPLRGGCRGWIYREGVKERRGRCCSAPRSSRLGTPSAKAPTATSPARSCHSCGSCRWGVCIPRRPAPGHVAIMLSMPGRSGNRNVLRGYLPRCPRRPSPTVRCQSMISKFVAKPLGGAGPHR